MGVDFSGPGGEFQLNWRGWGLMLDLAHDHGWEPVGIERRSIDDAGYVQEEEGTTFIDNWHAFSTEGAASLAAALERALDDIPDHEALAPKDLSGDGSTRIPGNRIDEVSALEWFSGPRKQIVRDLIQFCKAGGFTIS